MIPVEAPATTAGVSPAVVGASVVRVIEFIVVVDVSPVAVGVSVAAVGVLAVGSVSTVTRAVLIVAGVSPIIVTVLTVVCMSAIVPVSVAGFVSVETDRVSVAVCIFAAVVGDSGAFVSLSVVTSVLDVVGVSYTSGGVCALVLDVSIVLVCDPVVGGVSVDVDGVSVVGVFDCCVAVGVSADVLSVSAVVLGDIVGASAVVCGVSAVVLVVIVCASAVVCRVCALVLDVSIVLVCDPVVGDISVVVGGVLVVGVSDCCVAVGVSAVVLGVLAVVLGIIVGASAVVCAVLAVVLGIIVGASAVVLGVIVDASAVVCGVSTVVDVSIIIVGNSEVKVGSEVVGFTLRAVGM